jgi:hypothetical protein
MAKKSGGRKISKKVIVIAIIVAVVVSLVVGATLLYSYSHRVWSADLNHEQEVWLHALEWCESGGRVTEINKKDVDGTPSYFSFQFKPSTFKAFGIKYGLFGNSIGDIEIKNKLADYNLQKKIVSFMINDTQVNWRREFPDCTRRLGFPPRQK